MQAWRIGGFQGLGSLFIFVAFFLVGCGSSDDLSLEELNRRCAEGRLTGEYLVETIDRVSGNPIILKVPASSENDLLRKIRERNIEALAIDYNFNHATQLIEDRLPDRPFSLGFFGPDFIGAPKLWAQGIFGKGIKVALIDTGFDTTHPLLSNQILLNSEDLGSDEDQNGFEGDTLGWDFINNQPLTVDLGRHGTQVGSIIVAAHQEDTKIGIAPESKIIPIAALAPSEGGQQATGDSATLIRAIDYALNRGADIINASWGGDNCSRFLRTSVEKSVEKGVLFVAAAGNESRDLDEKPSFPSSFSLEGLLSVGATDASGQRISSSNYGSSVQFFAPGQNILALLPNDHRNLAFVTGTSIATPFVTGSYALLRSEFPHLPRNVLVQALLENSDESLNPFLPRALNWLHSQTRGLPKTL